MTDYVELHLHDHFSTLDGLNTPEEYMVRAKELGMTHLSQTNHGTLWGHREFQRAAKNAGITPILGLEGYISPTTLDDRRTQAKRSDGTSVYNHIILLAQNETGLNTMNRLSQRAYEDGYYFKPRIDTQLLESDNEGLVVLSGCMSGLIAKAIMNEDIETAEKWAVRYKEFLGDRFYIEVQGHNPVGLNMELLRIADKYGIKPVATSDCHYARKEDLWVEDSMLILSTSPKKNFQFDLSKAKKMDMMERLNYLYPDRGMTFEKFEIFLRDRKSNIELFSEQGIDRTDIYDNTVEIAHTVGEYPYYEGLDLLPSPTKSDPDKVLRSKIEHALKKKGFAEDEEYVKRAEEEVDIIVNKGFSSYILIVEDIISHAKSKGIPCGPGRGSAAGSLVCFLLDITMVDPIKRGLLFFRFIDPARDDFPDVDMDFSDARRPEIMEYTRQRYGHAAAIATFNRFGGKSSIKDAARVMGIPVGEVNRATKDNDAPPKMDYFDHFVRSPRGAQFSKDHPEVIDLARRMHGRIRSGGMHAAGLVVSKEPINNYAPVETAKDPSNPNGPRVSYIAVDMIDAASIGFIKMDFLGLKALTVIDDTLELVSQRTGNKVDLLSIDMHDRGVLDMLSKGYTSGVFQVEAGPYTNLILKMGGVASFDELVASNALVRPGAMNTIGVDYIARKEGREPIKFVHDDAKSFTKDTYGVCIYQEQVMLMMTEVAGMSMSDANKVRGIIGKKKDQSEFDAYRDKWMEGATAKITKKQAEKLWEDFEAHSGYSFNKSHAEAYSLMSYWMAWLKFHYPLEFMASTLRNETDKDTFTDYLIETRRLGIRVLLPHVNKSRLKISIEDNAIRLGLTNIKYIRDKAGTALLRQRPFKSYAHLEECSMQRGSGISTRVLASMNSVGAAAFPDNPKTGQERDNFYETLGIPAFEQKHLEPTVKAKFRTLDEYDDKSTFPILAMARNVKRGEGWARVDFIDDTGTAGVFIKADAPIEPGQMYAALVANNSVMRFMTMDELHQQIDNEFSRYLYDAIPDIPEGQYRVIAFKTHVTKAGKKMAHLVLMDHLGELIFAFGWPSLYQKLFVKARQGQTLKMKLKETDDGATFVDEV